MDYYAAMEEAMIEAREDSFLPTKMTRDQMLTAIDDITGMLKGCLTSDNERIILSAKRQELRLRLLRAEEIAQRLLGGKSGE